MLEVRERILVTGGSGFLGACLVHDLVRDGHEVHLLARAESDLWRFAAVRERVAFHWGDIRDAAQVREAVAACRPDVVYHLAAHGACALQRDRSAILATNLLGTGILLDALRGREYRALVYVGSSSEYGHKAGPIAPEEPLEPRTDYAVSKAAATLLCLSEARRGGPICCVRVFSAYGPWEATPRLVPYVMDCCRRGENPLVTSGLQPRDFIYAEDVVRLLKIAASGPECHGKVLHAGSGRQQCVRDIVDTIVAVCGDGRVSPVYGACPNRADEPESWVADIRCTTELTGWRPGYDLCEGVRRTWAWLTKSTGARAA